MINPAIRRLHMLKKAHAKTYRAKTKKKKKADKKAEAEKKAETDKKKTKKKKGK